MPRASKIDISPAIKTHPIVTVYLLVAIGLIVGTVAVIAYLFNGK